jgi:hypothetical protein
MNRPLRSSTIKNYNQESEVISDPLAAEETQLFTWRDPKKTVGFSPLCDRGKTGTNFSTLKRLTTGSASWIFEMAE